MSKIVTRIKGSFVKVKGPGSRKINKSLEVLMGNAFKEATSLYQTKAKEFALGINIPIITPYQKDIKNPSGELAESIETRILKTPGSKFEATVTATAAHSSYLEWGTGVYGDNHAAYEITPTHKKALAFDWKGKHYVVKKVTVKGQPPKPFMRGAKWFLEKNFKKYIRTGSKQRKVKIGIKVYG